MPLQVGDAPVQAQAGTPAPELSGVAETMVPDIQKILYVTDLSDTARHAVRYACSIGHRYGAEVTVLHVIPDLVDELSKGAGINLAEHMDRRTWESFNKSGMLIAREAITRRIRETSIKVKQEIPECPVNEKNILVKIGNPVKQIVATAEEGAYDLVIMGTHGHGKFGEAIIGSVASEVIRTSVVPVLVIRLPIAHP